MDTLHDDISKQHEVPVHAVESSGVLPTWCTFLLGGLVTFLFVYVGIARPAAQELSLLRRQLSTLEQSVWEIAGHRDAAVTGSELLTSLAQQGESAAAAKAALMEIRKLHEEILAEAEQVQKAMAATSELTALKDMLLDNYDSAQQAAEVAEISEHLYEQLAAVAPQTETALRVGYDLLTLREDLLHRGTQVEDGATPSDVSIWGG